jgi:hypothetical protein
VCAVTDPIYLYSIKLLSNITLTITFSFLFSPLDHVYIMDDFELPEGFDEPAGDAPAVMDNNYDDAFDEAEDVPIVPVYVEPTGMDAMSEIVEDSQLTSFNKKWQADIDAKATEEVKLASKLKSDAEEALSNWRKERDLRLKAKAESNRSEESVITEGLVVDKDQKAGWDRVLKLVDVTATDAQGKSDTSKMHTLFIQLKNEPIVKA